MFAFFNDLKGSLIKFPEQFFKGCNIANDMVDMLFTGECTALDIYHILLVSINDDGCDLRILLDELGRKCLEHADGVSKMVN